MQHVNLVLLLFGLLFSISIFSQNLDSDKLKETYIDFSAELDSLRKVHHIPGLAAAIIKDHQLDWSQGFGMSHFDTGDGDEFQKVSSNTPFWIASVTKTFLGLLFLHLEEEGIVDLNNKINDMPGWPNFCNWLSNSKIIFGKNLQCDSPITIQNVLNHTVNGKPGSQFLYNPIMYSRLSRYVEYVYGNPIAFAEKGHNKLAQLVQEKILGPAEMTRTMSSQWQRDKPLVYFDMAQGYQYKDGRYIALLRPERHLAGGAGIVSTVNDLAKYDVAIDKGLLSTSAVMEKLFSPAVDQNGIELPYAFGWYVQNYNGEKLIWHSGWDEEAGFSSLYLKIPEKKLTLILLANSEGLWWGNPLDQAVVEKSLYAKLFLDKIVFDDN